MGTKIADYFGADLAMLLSGKIKEVYERFSQKEFIENIKAQCTGMSYTQRVDLFANELYRSLPKDYELAIDILDKILGEENMQETGMFSNFYWLMPVAKYIEKFGLSHFELSMEAIGEITKRNTGEYTVRPFIKKYPDKSLAQMKLWAKSDNFHLRRLSSEGLRPKLPWATKLDIFINNPEPVFEILDILKEDPVMFVKKSVANHLTDWLKVNPIAGSELLERWMDSENEHTKWIIKHATRKIKPGFSLKG